ncbi:phosphoribosylformylglycinamidine synthase I [Candidatus Kaiserbacteria bacterium]|nr:phosphoribosylformylglycinamidine synthase I [Candidatus Kaiserbacteria bacterium]
MKERKKRLRVAVLRFPGSNCDFDTLRFFRRFGHEAEFVWYRDKEIPPADLIVLPGGFAFGDRSYRRATGAYAMDPGVLAVRSPIMPALRAAAKRGRPILGICNGFQILVHAGLLPGKLVQNKFGKFFCDTVACTVTGQSFFGDTRLLGTKFDIPIAHGYGRYRLPAKERRALEKAERIFLRYGPANPNGSDDCIAGVANETGTIFGLMPHPERSKHPELFVRAIERYVHR